MPPQPHKHRTNNNASAAVSAAKHKRIGISYRPSKRESATSEIRARPTHARAKRAALRRERNAPRFRSRPPPCALSALCFSSTHRNVVSYKCKKIRRNRSTPQKISPCNIKKTRYFGQRESPKYRVFSLNLPRGDCRAVEACEVARRNAALRSKATGVYLRT